MASKKEKKRQRLEAAFKDYFAFQESISRIPPHRVLAINRGERARILRVKMDADMDAMTAEADKLLIPDGHPHAEFLRSCVRDALSRLLIPSLERELRREMAEGAEEHAVEVFARNLRKLLLQPPVYNHRVLAVDPGFRSGCKLIALDEFGNVLGHEIIHVIGREDWIRAGRAKLVELIRRHRLSVIAIGNGAGCRETEQLVVDVMDKELKEEEVAFVIVNEAGASVYSTSPVGREELPTYDAVLRSAISIGRRLLDPLSELVKINPANIGVGMYQHDVKAKHLRNSLDAVVESCVNYVGVDVNTASPALLRYVSGMNQLTARRLCEYRAKHGPFRTRDQLKQVSGFGEATFVQAAGFLKISHGENPLDATWIHPESYALADKVLAKAGCDAANLVDPPHPPAAPPSAVPAPAFSSGLPTPNHASSESPTEAGPTAGAESSPVPMPFALEPTELTPKATEPAPEATEPASEPTELTAEPTERAFEPIERAPESTELTSEPAERALEPTPLAGEPTEVAAESTERGGEPTRQEDASSDDTIGVEVEPLRNARERVRQLDAHALAEELSVSEVLLRDILNSLARPGRDPREDFPAPVFRRGIVKLEDLQPGMTLSGTVLNVVDFGAFVDIGLPDSGLVHISRLADRFVRDPHEVVGVGDVLTVWVVDIDKQRRRVSLTAIEPGTEKPAESRREPPRQRPRRPPMKRPAERPAGGPPAGRAKTGAGDRSKTAQRPRPPQKPKFVKPITKEMEEGKEPLRSFSDLMQFYQKKPPDGK
ncbi:MAG: helix-hairpin-helix domain-containing protein [Pirellulaceae bacterium]